MSPTINSEAKNGVDLIADTRRRTGNIELKTMSVAKASQFLNQVQRREHKMLKATLTLQILNQLKALNTILLVNYQPIINRN